MEGFVTWTLGMRALSSSVISGNFWRSFLANSSQVGQCPFVGKGETTFAYVVLLLNIA